MEQPPRWADRQTRNAFPQCGPLRRVLNRGDVPIRIEGWYDAANMWAPLIPEVAAASEHEVPTGALWLPKCVTVRSVNLNDGTPLAVFGVVGNGMTVVQPPALAAAVPNDEDPVDLRSS